MLFLLTLFLGHIAFNHAAIFHCDFETDCTDFDFDSNWGLTDGNHPQGINHDHTLNSIAGHYRYYNPQSGTSWWPWAQIKTTNRLEPSNDRVRCFSVWYYTSYRFYPCSIQVGQGDDGTLAREIFSTSGQNISIHDWTLINVTLPNEELKIFIRVSSPNGNLTFDDFSVDYCDRSPPVPPKVIYSCDFESSCKDDFVSLSQYQDQWVILNATETMKIQKTAPSVDYTFGNASGHYAFLPGLRSGSAGYLYLQRNFQITPEESYCLQFEYYGVNRVNRLSRVEVYAWMLFEDYKPVQRLWPVVKPYQYSYTSDAWTWGAINLPNGNYSLLFRVYNADISLSTFAIDNIAIVSCAYPSSELRPDNSLLSFSCDFDHSTMCGLVNAKSTTTSANNFTIFTGDTVPNKNLGPTRDHTSNSTTGGFLYWNRQYPLTVKDIGQVFTLKTIVSDSGMCFKFAYYVKSASTNKNATQILPFFNGCSSSPVWIPPLDDSQGWQTFITRMSNSDSCEVTMNIYVNNSDSVPVSVAFDDIEFDQCSIVTPTTTSTVTTTTITSTPSTSTTTTFRSSTTTITQSSSTTSTSTFASTTRSNAHRVLSLTATQLILICILLMIR